MPALAQFRQSVSAADQLVGMYRELRKLRGLGARGRLDAANTDLLWLPRSAVVASISSLDAYVHHVLYDRIPPTLRKPPIPESLATSLLDVFSVKNAGDLMEHLPLLSSTDSLTELFSMHKDNKLIFASYQAPQKIEGAYRLIGVENVFALVSAMWPGPASSTDDIKRTLSYYVRRRNQIAHEGDRESHGAERPMQPEYASKCKDFVVSLVTRLHRVVYGP